MSFYNVTIRAVIQKTLTIEADCEYDAVEEAHALFSTSPEENEYYDEQTVAVDEETE
jgi:hypothetical protein